MADLRLPWERRYEAGRLTPVRVHRVVSSLLVELGTPAKAPKPCGRSPGRPKGRLSGRAKRYPALKKSALEGKNRQSESFAMGFIYIAKLLLLKTQAKSRFYAFYFARPSARIVNQVNGIVESAQEDQTISIEVLHKEKACSIPRALRRGSASYAG